MIGTKLRLDTRNNEKQKAALAAWNDKECTQIVYGGAKGGAKTHTGVFCVFAWALLYPDTRYFIARKNRSDLKKHTVPSIQKVLNEWGISQNDYTYNGQDFAYYFKNGSVVMLIECRYLPSDPEYYRFGSAQYTRGWIEEGGEVDSKAKNNLAATIGRWNNDKYDLKAKLLITCNPAKNFLYTEFYKPFKDGSLTPDKIIIFALPQDNKMLERDYVAHLESTLTLNQKRRLLLGLWEFEEDARALINYDSIINLFSNSYINEGKKYLTCDIARLGKDSTIIWVWSGFRGKPHKFKGLTIPEIIAEIEKIRLRHDISKSNVVADEGGLGVGVVDVGGYKGFNSANMPLQIEGEFKKEFRNLRAQVYFNLAQRINKNGYYIDCDSEERERITQELEWVKCTDDSLSGAKFQIISKEEIKENLGFSPDYADAMAMREFFELKQETEIDYAGFFLSQK